MKAEMSVVVSLSMGLSGYGVYYIYGVRGLAALAIIWGCAFGIAAGLMFISRMWNPQPTEIPAIPANPAIPAIPASMVAIHIPDESSQD